MVDLSKGIFLENQNVLIPWGISNEDAWKIGTPEPYNLPHDRTRVRWRNATVLSGLKCNVFTWFETADVKLHAFILEDIQSNRSYEDWKKILTEQCRKLFGNELHEGFWEFSNFHIQLRQDTRFVEAAWLQIRNLAVPCKRCEMDEAMRAPYRKKVGLE